MTNTNNLSLVNGAIELAIQTHEVDQKQKRKGKDIPYIVHPLAVGLILARAGARDAVIAAGILHDTIEDSIAEKKVTKEMIEDGFGPAVAKMVNDVSEQDKNLSWQERKREAFEHISVLEGDSLWVKTADTISNVSDLLRDCEKDPDLAFVYFNASKAEIITNYHRVIEVLIQRWGPQAENPMLVDLHTLAVGLEALKY
ncbi:MAG: HD domain-containing protein [Patescibacteria group bacterium]